MIKNYGLSLERPFNRYYGKNSLGDAMKKSKYFEKEDLKDVSILLVVCIISFSILVGFLGDSENDSIIELFTPDSKDSKNYFTS